MTMWMTKTNDDDDDEPARKSKNHPRTDLAQQQNDQHQEMLNKLQVDGFLRNKALYKIAEKQAKKRSSQTHTHNRIKPNLFMLCVAELCRVVLVGPIWFLNN